MDLIIRLADSSDVDSIVELLTEMSDWLRAEKDIVQWPETFPSKLVVGSVERGEAYVAVKGQLIVGTVTLQWSDASFWGNRSDAFFVHRLAARRDRPGVGRELLEWSADQAGKHGRRYLCLDVMTSNERLRRYYEDIGFRLVGEVRGPEDHPHTVAHGPWTATLYEKVIELQG